MILNNRQTIHLLKPEELSENDWQTWSDWVRANPCYSSPYFQPEFTQAVSTVCQDVRIVLFEEQEQVAGFLPIQISPQKVAYPVGNILSDYHAIISPQEVPFSGHSFLQQTGLKAFYFDHLLTIHKNIEPFQWGEEKSPYMDLSEGYEAYETERKKTGSSKFKGALRKERKMTREVGELRIVPNSTDLKQMERLLELKTEQYHRTQRPDVTGMPWVRDLLKEIWTHQSPNFSGMLTVLYANDQAVAFSFGMQSGRELHVWFPAYEPEFHNYSPGLILLLQQARSREMNLSRIDLGKGSERYKESFKSNDIPLWEGAIDSRNLQRWWNQKIYQTRQWTKTTPMGQHSLSIYRSLRSRLKPSQS